MTFRDDHDATLARAEALERELEETRRKLDASEAERERLRARVAKLEDEPAAPAERPRQRRAAPARSASGLVAVALIVGSVAAIFVVVMNRPSHRSTDGVGSASVRRTTCTISTMPAGAEVYRIVNDHAPGMFAAPQREDFLGNTPLEREDAAWTSDRELGDLVRYEARLVGYYPRHFASCVEGTYNLAPEP